MPARTTAKKTMPAKKTSAKKRSAKSSAPPRKAMKNGKMSEVEAAHAALLTESEQLRQMMREKDERIAGLERERPTLELQLHEVQARLTTGQAELEAARAEAARLREAARPRGPGEAVRCPRCGGKMTQQLLEQVKAERCDACHGIFFDNGELENVIKHHDQQRAAGQKSWLSGIFGKKTT